MNAPEPQDQSVPHFFCDRCVGAPVAERLAGMGWAITDHHEIFPDREPDESILRRVSLERWHLLTVDNGMHLDDPKLLLITRLGVCSFVLRDGSARAEVKADAFEAARLEIERLAALGGPAVYKLFRNGKLSSVDLSQCGLRPQALPNR